jgi:hypothetical protein
MLLKSFLCSTRLSSAAKRWNFDSLSLICQVPLAFSASGPVWRIALSPVASAF